MKYISYLALLLAAIFLASCEKREVIKYEDKDCLYFYRFTWGQKDSIMYSFSSKSDDVELDTVWVDVRTMGATSDKPRPVSMKQLNTGEPDAGIAGTHYISFDDPAIQGLMQVEAQKAQMMLPVIIMRHPSLKQQTVRIQIGIASNEYFTTGIEQQQTFLVKVTDKEEEPGNWSTDWVYVFGPWSSLKMQFISKYVGIKDFDEVPSDGTYRIYLKAKAGKVLNEYNAAERAEGRPPLCSGHIGDINNKCENCVEFPRN